MAKINRFLLEYKECISGVTGQATVGFLMENISSIKASFPAADDSYRLICVDGKEEKGTGRKYGTSEEVRNLHWHLDYNFSEDDNSTMDKKAFTNLSLINKMCLSLCKPAQPIMGKSSLKVIRKRFSWNLERNLALLLNTFNEEVLREGHD